MSQIQSNASMSKERFNVKVMSQCQSNIRIKSKKKTHNKILLRSGFTVTFRTTKEIEVINGKYCPRIMVSRHGFLTKYYVVQVYTLQIEKKQKMD